MMRNSFSKNSGTRTGTYPDKDRRWRGCLASALHPHMGPHAQDILIALITTPMDHYALDRTAFDRHMPIPWT